MNCILSYQVESNRTLNKTVSREKQIDQMVYGIVGETGEVIDILKKHLHHGHELDVENVKEEIGDVVWYLSNLCTILDISLQEVLDMNVAKLQRRYPCGFDSEKSINRES